MNFFYKKSFSASLMFSVLVLLTIPKVFCVDDFEAFLRKAQLRNRDIKSGLRNPDITWLRENTPKKAAVVHASLISYKPKGFDVSGLKVVHLPFDNEEDIVAVPMHTRFELVDGKVVPDYTHVLYVDRSLEALQNYRAPVLHEEYVNQKGVLKRFQDWFYGK